MKRPICVHPGRGAPLNKWQDRGSASSPVLCSEMSAHSCLGRLRYSCSTVYTPERGGPYVRWEPSSSSRTSLAVFRRLTASARLSASALVHMDTALRTRGTEMAETLNPVTP